MPLIDVTRLCGRLLAGRLPTGVDRVSLEYVRHFRRARALVRYGGRWVVLGASDSARMFDTLLDPGKESGRVIRWSVGSGFALNWRPTDARVLLNTGHSGLERADYAVRIRHRQLRAVFFLHDLIPITHPEYSRPGEADSHHRRLHTMLSAGSAIIVNSRSTLRALEAHAAAHALRLPRCEVVPLAPMRLPLPASERPLEARYFVVLGTIEPRKNHWMLLHLWRQLADELGQAAPRLVLIGQRGWECEQVTDLLERCESLRGLVIEEPKCSDARLATWLHHAQALLFPSFVEGYGMPLPEALTAGVPVIASDLAVFREIADEIPDYLDPLDGAGWKAAVLDYARPDSRRRRAQVERLGRFQAPSWESHFSVVEDLIEHIGGHD
ncbi:MAG TPA: glycosyltransferase family 1 protein [Steroidobacteraceae bacterium]|nr:glycosyltransferase family 1 protein [Steroidobacteraceae bacterium]